MLPASPSPSTGEESIPTTRHLRKIRLRLLVALVLLISLFLLLSAIYFPLLAYQDTNVPWIVVVVLSVVMAGSVLGVLGGYFTAQLRSDHAAAAEDRAELREIIMERIPATPVPLHLVGSPPAPEPPRRRRPNRRGAARRQADASGTAEPPPAPEEKYLADAAEYYELGRRAGLASRDEEDPPGK